MQDQQPRLPEADENTKLRAINAELVRALQLAQWFSESNSTPGDESVRVINTALENAGANDRRKEFDAWALGETDTMPPILFEPADNQRPVTAQDLAAKYETTALFSHWASTQGHALEPDWMSNKNTVGFDMWIGWQGAVRTIAAALVAQPAVETAPTEVDRKDILLKAAYDLLKKQERAPYVLNLLTATAHWDDAECDGHCLMTEIADVLRLEQFNG